MVELRKRRDAPADVPEPPLKKTNSTTKAKPEATPVPSGTRPNSTTRQGKALKLGDTINLDKFGGEIETQDGEKTSLKKLVEESNNGVVLFTFPKASTPCCTTQASLFRDQYTQLTATGLAIFGLSTDSPKSNTTFKTKQNLPYTLLCDPNVNLISAIGMKKAPKGTIRGVFVVDKVSRVKAIEAGGPQATVDVVRKLVQAAGTLSDDDISNMVGKGPISPATNSQENSDEVRAEVAAQVADTAQNLDADADELSTKSGVPLNPQYRNPPPGANPPEVYDDPVTVPSGDIAENAYFRRDVRRNYPRLSVVKQGDIAGLLSVGSKANPKEEILQVGDAGTKQLVEVQHEGEEKGLAALFEKEKTSIASILGANGLPPFPTGASRLSPQGGRKYVLDVDRENGYPEE
ncbi:MAG: hypothetical protein Q9219_005799 [cf. Caloplaca sp. 3 TL-2023]